MRQPCGRGVAAWMSLSIASEEVAAFEKQHALGRAHIASSQWPSEGAAKTSEPLAAPRRLAMKVKERVKERRSSKEFLPENDVPCILAVDLNSDAHLEPPMAQEVLEIIRVSAMARWSWLPRMGVRRWRFSWESPYAGRPKEPLQSL